MDDSAIRCTECKQPVDEFTAITEDWRYWSDGTALLPYCANRWGRAYKTAGTASATLDTKTKVRGGGMKTVADLVANLKAGDRVLVQARVCKDDLKDPSAKPPLTASKVIGHPAKAAKDEKDEKRRRLRFSLGGNRSSM